MMVVYDYQAAGCCPRCAHRGAGQLIGMRVPQNAAPAGRIAEPEERPARLERAASRNSGILLVTAVSRLRWITSPAVPRRRDGRGGTGQAAPGSQMAWSAGPDGTRTPSPNATSLPTQ